jgi:Dehydrogenase E1 component
MSDLPPEILLDMQRRMLRIRYFDERASLMVKRGHIPGTVHTSIGQEAQVVGATMALGEHDYMSGNHRSHGHPIGKGSPLGPLMAELVGKADGVCGGKGGSLHLAGGGVRHERVGPATEQDGSDGGVLGRAAGNDPPPLRRPQLFQGHPCHEVVQRRRDRHTSGVEEAQADLADGTGPDHVVQLGCGEEVVPGRSGGTTSQVPTPVRARSSVSSRRSACRA